MYENGYKSLINKYTRVDKNSKTCIDHIFLKSKYICDEALTPIILHSKVTDHYPIILQCDLSLKNENTPVQKNIKKYINYSKLREILK